MIKDRIQHYYRTERISSVVLSAVGALSSSIGLLNYLFQKSELSLGLMLGLCIVGSYQIIVGLIRLIRSRTRFNKCIEGVDKKNNYIQTIEYPRIIKKESVIKQMRYTEISVLFASVAFMIFFFFKANNHYMMGTLVGLCFHSGFLICFDLFSQFRIQEYIHQINKYLKS